jgi:purine nucleosidase
LAVSSFAGMIAGGGDMRTRAVAVLVAMAAMQGAIADARPPTPVIMDQDGAVDDMVALALLLKSPAVDLRAVTLTPADSYLGPATAVAQRLVARLGKPGITIAQGHSEGLNRFPADWRRDHAGMLSASALKGVKPAPVAAEDAPHSLVRLLSGTTRYTIVETGPLTNVADALRLKPSIARNIARIYVMGGALRVKGNVEQAGHDGSAEWNMFNQPEAAAEVMASGVPITLVPLDATNHVPMTAAFIDRLAQRPGAGARFAAQAMRRATADYPGEYYFWDPLTAAALIDPTVVTLAARKVKVVTSGRSQGRTVEAPDGVPVQAAVDADRAKLERLFLDVLGR